MIRPLLQLKRLSFDNSYQDASGGEIAENVEIIGNDLNFRSAFSGPTSKISELTFAGV